jgi:TolB-like protein
MRQRQQIGFLTLVLALVLGFLGCRSMRPTTFTNPDFNFAFVERVAVLPLENLSQDNQAGARTTRILVTALLASEAIDVVEMGEVTAALNRLPGSPQTPSTEQIIALGETLQVQALIMGSVNQSETLRSGSVNIPVVTVDLHMVETESGQPVWAATNSERGSGASAKWLGVGAEPISETTRACVQVLVKKLVK